MKRVVMMGNNVGEEGTTGDSHAGVDGEEGESAATTTVMADKSDNRNVDGDENAIDAPIVMAVDVSDPSEVQPVVERMRNAILNAYGSKREEEKARAAATATTIPHRSRTTSVKALQNLAFGRTKIQAEVGSSTSSSGGRRIALILAAILPPVGSSSSSSASTAEEYAERQARALVMYHLHKFSLEADCTLCFVRPGGKAAEKEEEEDEMKANGGDTTSPPPSVHAPGTHDGLHRTR